MEGDSHTEPCLVFSAKRNVTMASQTLHIVVKDQKYKKKQIEQLQNSPPALPRRATHSVLASAPFYGLKFYGIAENRFTVPPHLSLSPRLSPLHHMGYNKVWAGPQTNMES